MRGALGDRWSRFKQLPAGERFERVHEQQRNAPSWVKFALIAGALLSFAIGVLLTVLPGPAFVFYGLAGALLAVESATVARALDRFELLLRSWKRRIARRRRRTRGNGRRSS